MKPALKTRESRLTPLTGLPRQLVLGTLLGDGSMAWRDSTHGRYRVNHGEAQAEYCRHKAAVLADYVRSAPTIVPSLGWGRATCGFSTVTSPVFEFIRSACYRPDATGRLVKTVTPEWLAELDWAGVAYWYLDDGTLQDTGAMVFCTHSFPEAQVRLLAAWLTGRGVEALPEATRKGERRYWTIRLRQASSRALVERIRPFVPSCMAYKIALPPEPALITCAFCRAAISESRRRTAALPSCDAEACRGAQKRKYYEARRTRQGKPVSVRPISSG